MCKASAILKEEIFNDQFFYSKFIDLQFSRKVVISICSFPKTTYDLQIVRPYFAPWSVLWREEIGVYVSELWSYWTWTIKALAKSLDFCWQTNAKWLGILQWLEFPPHAGLGFAEMVIRSLLTMSMTATTQARYCGFIFVLFGWLCWRLLLPLLVWRQSI